MLEMHREVSSISNEAAQSAAASARLFMESLPGSERPLPGADDSLKSTASPSNWLTFGTESLYGNADMNVREQASIIENKIKNAAAQAGFNDEPLKPETANQPAKPPVEADPALDNTQQAVPVPGQAEFNVSDYVEGDRLALERDEHGNLEGMDQMGTKLTQLTNGTTIIESENSRIKVSPDGHATITSDNQESRYDLKQLPQSVEKNGATTYELPDGGKITRKVDVNGNFSGFVIAPRDQQALETYFGDHHVLYGRSLRK